MNDGYFDRIVDGATVRFHPRPTAHGPWATNMLHGRLIGGLGAQAIEAEFGGPAWRVARLTVDLFRPSAMEPVTITIRPVRTGRRLQVVDAVLHCAGHDVARISAVLLPVGSEPPGRVWAPDPTPWPAPETLPDLQVDNAEDDDDDNTNDTDRNDNDRNNDTDGDGDGDDGGWLFRLVAGGFGTGEQTRMWTNDTVPLVAGEPMTPLVRAAVTGDIACPLGNSGDQGLFFINADYTMLIGRYPVGEWIGLEVDHRIAADGIAIASATLVDRDGPFATSGGTSLARSAFEGHR